MNRTELIRKMAEAADLSFAKAELTYEAAVEAIMESLQSGEKVGLAGFGTFETAERAARTGRNPRTGEAIDIPKKTFPRFRPGKAFRETTAARKKN